MTTTPNTKLTLEPTAIARAVIASRQGSKTPSPFQQRRHPQDLDAATIEILNPTDPDEPLAVEDLRALKKGEKTRVQSHTEADGTKINHEESVKVFVGILKGTKVPQTLADLTPDRIRVAHRLVREMARHRGFVAPDEMLIEGIEPAFEPKKYAEMAPQSLENTETEENGHVESPELPQARDASTGLILDKWVYPIPYVEPAYDNKNPTMRFFLSVKQIMLEAERISQTFLPWQWVAKQIVKPDTTGKTSHLSETRWFPHFHPGLALLPPEVPYVWMTPTGEINREYDPTNPRHDPALHAYIRMIKALTSALYIDSGTPDGAPGLEGMFEPMFIRGVFPSRTQIMAWEMLLVEETLDNLTRYGQPQARKRLMSKYGYQDLEVQQFIKMARVRAQQLVSGGSEEDRALMILRLEDIARRARSALDLRAEIAALKNLAIVQGLSQTEPQDAMSDFVRIVKTVANESGNGMKQLPGQ